MEENISEIFSLFHEFKLKVNLIQNTAISFSVCEDKFDNFNELNAILSKKKFKVDFSSQNVTLYTIRHFNAAAETVEQELKCDFKKTDQY
jgi:aspartate kinase